MVYAQYFSLLMLLLLNVGSISLRKNPVCQLEELFFRNYALNSLDDKSSGQHWESNHIYFHSLHILQSSNSKPKPITGEPKKSILNYKGSE